MTLYFGKLPVTVVSQSRMMQCDDCQALTNHNQDDNGDLICAVCGRNATQVLRADEHTAEVLSKFVGYLLVAMCDGCLEKWLTIFVDLLADEAGEDAVRLLVDVTGRRRI